VLENKKKAKTEAETRKRTSRVKVKEMRKESSDESRSPSPVPKKKKATKKVTKKGKQNTKGMSVNNFKGCFLVLKMMLTITHELYKILQICRFPTHEVGV
jgi:hypothetical protein